jgi:DNA-binding NarL/FixJ family response regulator
LTAQRADSGERPAIKGNKMKIKKQLTKREEQIGRLLINGLTYMQISNVLKISDATVRCLASRMYLALGVNNRYHATEKLKKIFKEQKK